jgi:hypothetical protein
MIGRSDTLIKLGCADRAQGMVQPLTKIPDDLKRAQRYLHQPWGMR